MPLSLCYVGLFCCEIQSRYPGFTPHRGRRLAIPPSANPPVIPGKTSKRYLLNWRSHTQIHTHTHGGLAVAEREQDQRVFLCDKSSLDWRWKCGRLLCGMWWGHMTQDHRVYAKTVVLLPCSVPEIQKQIQLWYKNLPKGQALKLQLKNSISLSLLHCRTLFLLTIAFWNK